jgi:hypothetical protein
VATEYLTADYRTVGPKRQETKKYGDWYIDYEPLIVGNGEGIYVISCACGLALEDEAFASSWPRHVSRMLLCEAVFLFVEEVEIRKAIIIGEEDIHSSHAALADVMCEFWDHHPSDSSHISNIP